MTPGTIIDNTLWHWRVDEQVIGSSTRNMEEDRDGHSHGRSFASSLWSDQHAEVDYHTNTRPRRNSALTLTRKETTLATGHAQQSSGRKCRAGGLKKHIGLWSILAAAPSAMAQSCISLSGSTTCPAFSSASISTNPTLIGLL